MDFESLDELPEHEDDMRTVREHDVPCEMAERERYSYSEDVPPWLAAWRRAAWA